MPLAERQSSQPGPNAVLLADSMEKLSPDDRDYRVVRFSNKLEALLVHDPETDKLDTKSIEILSKAGLQGVSAETCQSIDLLERHLEEELNLPENITGPVVAEAKEARPKRLASDDHPGSNSMAVTSATEITDLRHKSGLAMSQDTRPVKDLSKFMEPVHWAFVPVDSCIDCRLVERAQDDFNAMLQKHSIWAQRGHVLNPPGLTKGPESTVTWARHQLSNYHPGSQLLYLIIQETDFEEYTGTLHSITSMPENQDVIIRTFIRSCINNWREPEYRKALEKLISQMA